MKKALEVLETGKKRTKVVATLDDGNALLSKQEVEVIKKELKALEIIKNAFVVIKTKHGGYFLETKSKCLVLTKDEYDLLKEVLL